MKVKPVTPQDAVDLLNEASQLDPASIRFLIERRAVCTPGLADHPTIQVNTDESGTPYVGLLGVINGLFGVDENTCGSVIAFIPDDPKAAITFALNPNFTE